MSTTVSITIPGAAAPATTVPPSLRPASARLMSQAASLSLAEMLVLSQRNKGNILAIREWLSGFSWCSSGEKTLLFLPVLWGPGESGPRPWPSVVRFGIRQQRQSLLGVRTLRFPGGRVLPLVKIDRDDDDEEESGFS